MKTDPLDSTRCPEEVGHSDHPVRCKLALGHDGDHWQASIGNWKTKTRHERFLILSLKWTRVAHLVWYRPQAAGYTANLAAAGRYTADEARDHTAGGDGDVIAVPEAAALALPSIRVIDSAKKHELVRLFGTVRS